MRYTEYKAWFIGERNKLTLEAGCTEVGPFWTPTPPLVPPWQVNWCVRFLDGKHFKVKESWWPRPIRHGGRGYRKHFGFHYGPINPASDSDGFPLRDNKTYPPIIRIDTDPYGPHLHYDGKDHIVQSDVQGLDISNADLFEFVKMVLRHRTTGEAFDKLYNFKVIP